MFPAETAGDGGFETDVLGRIPLVEQGIFDERLVEPEHEVAELRHFVAGIGIIQHHGMTITGRQKNNNHQGCQDIVSNTHSKGLKVKLGVKVQKGIKKNRLFSVAEK